MFVTDQGYKIPLSFLDCHFLDSFFLMITRGREHLLNFPSLAQASLFPPGDFIYGQLASGGVFICSFSCLVTLL